MYFLDDILSYHGPDFHDMFPLDRLSYQISIPHWEPHVSRVKVPVLSTLYTHRLPDTL